MFCDFIKFKISEIVVIAPGAPKLGTCITVLESRHSGLLTRVTNNYSRECPMIGCVLYILCS